MYSYASVDQHVHVYVIAVFGKQSQANVCFCYDCITYCTAFVKCETVPSNAVQQRVTRSPVENSDSLVWVQSSLGYTNSVPM